jgi:hypothetical protein
MIFFPYHSCPENIKLLTKHKAKTFFSPQNFYNRKPHKIGHYNRTAKLPESLRAKLQKDTKKRTKQMGAG